MKTEVIASGTRKRFTPIFYIGGIKGKQFALYPWNNEEGAQQELKRLKKALKEWKNKK